MSAALSNLVIIFAALKGSGKVIDPIQAGDSMLSFRHENRDAAGDVSLHSGRTTNQPCQGNKASLELMKFWSAQRFAKQL